MIAAKLEAMGSGGEDGRSRSATSSALSGRRVRVADAGSVEGRGGADDALPGRDAGARVVGGEAGDGAVDEARVGRDRSLRRRGRGAP